MKSSGWFIKSQGGFTNRRGKQAKTHCTAQTIPKVRDSNLEVMLVTRITRSCRYILQQGVMKQRTCVLNHIHNPSQDMTNIPFLRSYKGQRKVVHKLTKVQKLWTCETFNYPYYKYNKTIKYNPYFPFWSWIINYYVSS